MSPVRSPSLSLRLCLRGGHVTCWPLQLPVQVGASHVWHISQWPAGGAEKLFRLFLLEQKIGGLSLWRGGR